MGLKAAKEDIVWIIRFKSYGFVNRQRSQHFINWVLFIFPHTFETCLSLLKGFMSIDRLGLPWTYRCYRLFKWAG